MFDHNLLSQIWDFHATSLKTWTWVPVLGILAEINTKIAEMEQKIKTAETDIDVKNETIIKANEKIQELASKIAELTPYKEAADVAEKKKS